MMDGKAWAWPGFGAGGWRVRPSNVEQYFTVISGQDDKGKVGAGPSVLLIWPLLHEM